MQDVLGRGPDPLYDLITDEVATPQNAATAEVEASYFNLGLVDFDEAIGQFTIAISGNRG